MSLFLAWLRFWQAVILVVLPVAVFAQPNANLDRFQTEAIIAAFRGMPPDNFNVFLTRLSSLAAGRKGNVEKLIQDFQQGKSLTDEQGIVLYRLLGIYTRLKYADQALNTLARLVSMPTYRVEGLAQEENPQFHRFAEVLESIAAEFDLSFRNVDERVYEFRLEGDGEELIGIHAHADVVPVNPDLWVLEDGTRLNPFVMTRIGDRLYGRGTEDDKNAIVVSLYAMKVIKEERLPLWRDILLLVDTTEESSSTAMGYYFERNPMPAYNIALDGAYPVIIAEKGYGTVNAVFPLRKATGSGAQILSLSGGVASNQIPASSVAIIESDSSPGAMNRLNLTALLNREGAEYAAEHGGNFSIIATLYKGERIRLEVRGVSAHSSAPQSGVNPVSRMLDFIHRLEDLNLFKQNHFIDAARYASENWGLDYYGNKLGIGFADDFMGPMTAALTYIEENAEALQLTVNLRIPKGKALTELRQDIQGKLQSWAQAGQISVSFNYYLSEPMSRNPAGAWVNALLDVAVENLGLPRHFGSSSGATSVHNLPNGVQFGMARPDRKYTGHNANEFKSLNQFLLDLQIVTEMLWRIGNMPNL